MLQTTCMSPELLVNQTMSESEICGYSPGQGSPLPGETASPKSCLQQSPSLPDSGLTELNVASPKIYHPPPPCKPPGMAAPADSELSSDPPQKRYMGVRVKMPVRELLRKIRLSKGLEPAHSKEASSVKMVTKGSSGKTAEKRRAHPYTEKQLRQSKQSVGQTLKGLEDLDILVEVLQEDLNKSQLREEPLPPVPDGFWQGFSRDLQSCQWETGGGKEAAAGLQGRQPSSAELPSDSCLKGFQPAVRGEAEPAFHGEQGSARGSGSPGVLPRTAEKGSSCRTQEALAGSQEGFPRPRSLQSGPAQPGPAGMLPAAPGGSPRAQGCSLPAPAASAQHDLSALSFFQFQLHREESLLRNIPEEELLAPDEHGNRLLHKAVAQGRRALTFALAQRFASLNKIDEKDAEKRTALHLAAEKNQHLMVSDLISLGANVNAQDSSGKTPLHLCAQNGYLRVLEVLKSCKNNGVCVEVDLPDHYGRTPLHCAALARSALLARSRRAAGDTRAGRLLGLRGAQVLEGMRCLLQMGARPGLQAPNARPTSGVCAQLEENAELTTLLHTHQPRDVLQEGIFGPCQSYSLLDAPRGMPSPPAPDNFPELCSMSSADLFDVILKGNC